jgi:hypothetical protein
MDLGDWLQKLGLERYEAAFRENEINEKVLSKLTTEDLKELGVTAPGHRCWRCIDRPRWRAVRHGAMLARSAHPARRLGSPGPRLSTGCVA